MSRFSSVTIAVDDTDPREPNALCDRCGKSGTIARATRHSEPPLILRYCATCWPVVRKELQARQEEEIRQSHLSPETTKLIGWSWVSRSWDDVLHFLELISQPPKGGPAPNNEDFAAIAFEIRSKADEMVGEMPAQVQAFVDRYSTPAG